MDSKYFGDNQKKLFHNKRPNHITLNGSCDFKKIRLNGNNKNSPMKQTTIDEFAIENDRKALPIYHARQE